MEIRHIPYKDIDTRKWDACIQHSPCAVTFAYSWYLDQVCDQWDALVGDDYAAVMPLPLQKRLNNLSVFTPPFTRYLGLFGAKQLNSKLLNEFLGAIPSKYRGAHLILNPFNSVTGAGKRFERRFTYNIDMMEGYLQITSNLAKDTRNEINRAVANGGIVQKSIGLNQLIDFLLSFNKEHYYKRNLTILKRLIVHGSLLGLCQTYASYSNRNELSAVGVFLRSNSKVHCLMCAQVDERNGRPALYLLIDSVIYDFARKPLVLEFDGADTLNQQVFSSFAPTQVQYHQYKAGRRKLWDII